MALSLCMKMSSENRVLVVLLLIRIKDLTVIFLSVVLKEFEGDYGLHIL